MLRFLLCALCLMNAHLANIEKPTRPVSIWVCGDVMTGRGTAPLLQTKRTTLSFWRDEIERCDLAFCNLEGAFGNDNFAIQQREKPRLLLDESTPQLLAKTGFDVVSQANNHALDGGENGLRQLRKALQQQGISTVGAQFDDEWKPCRTTIRGQKITWLAASVWGRLRSGNARVRSLQNSNLIAQVRTLSQHGERVLVSLHWGIEYSKSPTLGQMHVAHKLIDAGALAVIGHHPHVAQTVEIYKNRPIFYSLGNFLFDRTPRPQSGLAAILHINGREVSWRTFVIEPQAGKLQAKKLSTRKTDFAPFLQGEKLIQQNRGHFLCGEKTSQILTWTKRQTGQDVLRVWKKEGVWKVVARAFPRPALALRVGDVDGDGTDEFAVELWQRSKLDMNPKRRLHFYSVRDGRTNHSSGFVPRWRGSALSRPFRSWCFVGGNDTKSVDLAAIEYSNDRDFMWLSVYRWNRFGFRVLWQTPARGTLRQLQSGRDLHGVWLQVVQVEKGKARTLVLRPSTQANVMLFRAGEVRQSPKRTRSMSDG